VETLESLSRRIETTEELGSIVRTMKSLSAVSIRQYERAVEALEEYGRTVDLGLRIVLPRLAEPPAEGAEPGAVAVIVFGSDHGLCGRFNDQIGESAREHVRRDPEAAEARWLTVGARTAARLAAAGSSPAEALLLPGAPSGLVTTARTILLVLDRWRAEEDVRRVLVAHNRHTEEATAVPVLRQLLPLDPAWLRSIAGRSWPSRRLPTYSMDTERLFSALVREHLFLSIFRAGAESMASEHASRLSAMQAAERNIEETLEELGGSYRRVRQRSITEELLDVVSGFEALRSES